MRESFETPKFDKLKCLKCQYHGNRAAFGYPVRDPKDGNFKSVYCDYTCKTGKAVLVGKPHRQTYDRRGEDYSGCRLFKAVTE